MPVVQWMRWGGVLLLVAAEPVAAVQMAENDPSRIAEIEALGKAGDAPARQALQKHVLDRAAGPWERLLAVKALVLTRDGGLALLRMEEDSTLPEELRAAAGLACASSLDADVRAQAARLLPLPKTKDGQSVPPLSKLFEMKGDAKAGGLVYRNESGAQCISCHQIREEGKMVGPPLTTIGDKLSKRQLYESILAPSAAIPNGYEQWIVRTKDGKAFTGIVVEDTKERVNIRDSKGDYHDVPAADVTKRIRQRLSMMADNAVGLVTLQELVDLVEFLAQQQDK